MLIYEWPDNLDALADDDIRHSGSWGRPKSAPRLPPAKRNSARLRDHPQRIALRKQIEVIWREAAKG